MSELPLSIEEEEAQMGFANLLEFVVILDLLSPVSFVWPSSERPAAPWAHQQDTCQPICCCESDAHHFFQFLFSFLFGCEQRKYMMMVSVALLKYLPNC